MPDVLRDGVLAFRPLIAAPTFTAFSIPHSASASDSPQLLTLSSYSSSQACSRAGSPPVVPIKVDAQVLLKEL